MNVSKDIHYFSSLARDASLQVDSAESSSHSIPHRPHIFVAEDFALYFDRLRQAEDENLH